MRLRYGQTRADRPNGTTEVHGTCQVTGKAYSVVVPTAGLDAWLGGALIQEAMPGVPKDEREFLVSSTSPEGWTALFGDGDDDE